MSSADLRRARFLAGGLASLLAGGCGATAPSAVEPDGTSPNVQPIVVDGGPTGDYVDGVFTSVTVCVPGTTTCRTIDHVLVDTGSSGLRLVSSVLALPLAPVTDAGGSPIVECNQFQDSYQWGPMVGADVRIAGELAPAVPIQAIGDPAFRSVPDDCISSGLPAEDTVEALGANGVLGVGLWRQDCGPACASPGDDNPGLYYSCPPTGCRVAAVPVEKQAQNPVWLFAGDNNGVVLRLPSISDSGVATVSGSLVFGIGTRANNSLGAATVFAVDDFGDLTTTFRGSSYDSSFVDSGTNGIFFLDSAATGMPTCDDASDFYCPASPVALSATIGGLNGARQTVAFRIASADVLFDSPNAAFDDLGGPSSSTFAWGLPFFFGRTVFTAIEAQTTPAGRGPFVAY